MDAPNFLSKPCLVVGIPVCRAKLCLAPDIPKALFHEKEKPYVLRPIVRYTTILTSGGGGGSSFNPDTSLPVASIF